MNDLFKNKFRTQSTRLSSWDYSSNSNYFITICTERRLRHFGEIDNCGLLDASIIGKYTQACWSSIPKHFPFIALDAFILMPDHLHGILCIGKTVQSGWHKNKFGPQSQNLASAIRGFKGAVKMYANRQSIDFHWQPRYYDRIIRDDRALNQIRKYIHDNPYHGIL